VRFAGQEILALAAENAQQAEEAAKLIKIDYTELPFVVDLDKAMAADAPAVFSKADEPTPTMANIKPARIYPDKGGPLEVDQLLKSSHQVVEATYRTQVQTHSPMETHGVVAHWKEDELTVWASTQGTFNVRDDIADYFNIPKSKIRVITKFMGGGFGSKLKADIYSMLAVKLSREAGRPVRLMLSRKEDHLATGNRPDSLQTVTIGADKAGKITAIKLKSFGTPGVGGGAGTSGPAKFIYDAEKIYTEESDVYTNAGPAAPFRAPGHPQGAFALEQAIDEMAYRLGMDPLEFRKQNTLSDKVRQVEYRYGAERAGWNKRNPKAGSGSGVIRSGLGVANSLWYYIYMPGSHVSLNVNDDGSVNLLSGVQDIGSGIVTPMAMIVAEELGLSPADINVTIGDTAFGLAPASGGSQTTSGLTPAVRNAAWTARQRILDIVASELKCEIKDLSIADGKIYISQQPESGLTWKEACKKIRRGEFTVSGDRGPDYYEPERFKISGVQFADVDVDTGTGSISVKRVVAIHDCGRPMDRLTLENQINGGIIQGISYALFENRQLDRNTGRMVNPNMEMYKIAGSMDIPEIETYVVDLNLAQSSTGAIGIGEPATVPTSAAIANAVYHAIGVRIRELPMTPARVLAALESAKGEGR
ncbi:MAG: xanthine dehydrogenase family protein molybdopterin-binding subunit, partial [Calditrichales bacterium]